MEPQIRREWKRNTTTGEFLLYLATRYMHNFDEIKTAQQKKLNSKRPYKCLLTLHLKSASEKYHVGHIIKSGHTAAQHTH